MLSNVGQQYAEETLAKHKNPKAKAQMLELMRDFKEMISQVKGCLFDKTRTGVSFTPEWLLNFVLRLERNASILS